ncbi:hypothetical protein [Streptomyces sp. SP18BB07]|uniref:hypothetical protein n=1 Tax=Streptomyces sp. SP18BB07 TaxID=3002522 RepID=UPI002E78B614|nr:hypothetical protein [Streptomyces sp. SP18BB07]MEE1764467.1 hypothetical protein [Streptomyces sp. SP18BB07]
MTTATARAEAMALQVLISARLHNGRVVTHDLVDAVMSRDYATEQGKANKEMVRRIIRKRAASEFVRVIFTEDERYWAIREQLHRMRTDEVRALRDEIAGWGDDDPRSWDQTLNNAISVRLSARQQTRRLQNCEPVSIRLWREPRRTALPSPRDLDQLSHELIELGPTAPVDLRPEITEAQADVEDAREALRTAHTGPDRDRATRNTHAAVKRAHAAIRAVEERSPNFAAFRAHAVADTAALRLRPEDLTELMRHLLALAPGAPSPQRRALVPAHRALEAATAAVEAADALDGLAGLQASNAAHDQARDAIEEARAAILAIEPTAKQMRGTDMPVTPETIRAAARAYNVANTHPEELAAIETGTPTVQVWSRSSGGLGREIITTITAGIRADIGHVPAHPPIVLRFRRLDGRMTAAENARRLLWRVNPAKRYLRVEDVPVEFEQDSRV